MDNVGLGLHYRAEFPVIRGYYIEHGDIFFLYLRPKELKELVTTIQHTNIKAIIVN